MRIRLQDGSILHLNDLFSFSFFVYDKDLRTNAISANKFLQLWTGRHDKDLIRTDTRTVIGKIVRDTCRVQAYVLDWIPPSVESGEGQNQVTPALDATQRRVAHSIAWHAKLGHPGEKAFNKFKKDLSLEGVNHIPLSQCDTCLLAKSKMKYPGVLDTESVTRPFEVLNVDLAGHYDPTGYDNARFFFLLLWIGSQDIPMLCLSGSKTMERLTS